MTPAPGESADALLPLLFDDDLVTVLPGPTAEHPLLRGKTAYYRCGKDSCLPPTDRPRPASPACR